MQQTPISVQNETRVRTDVKVKTGSEKARGKGRQKIHLAYNKRHPRQATKLAGAEFPKHTSSLIVGTRDRTKSNWFSVTNRTTVILRTFIKQWNSTASQRACLFWLANHRTRLRGQRDSDGGEGSLLWWWWWWGVSSVAGAAMVRWCMLVVVLDTSHLLIYTKNKIYVKCYPAI